MRKKPNRFLFMVGTMTTILFVAGVWYFFELRFSAGDIYPPYSSFRADPLGVRVFYTALGTLPGLEVGRNLDSVHQLEPASHPTLFFLGLPSPIAMRREPPSDTQNEGSIGMNDVLYDLEDLDLFVRLGGRLVISFRPMTESPEKEEVEKETRDNDLTDKKNDVKQKEKKPRKKKASDTPSWGMVFNCSIIKGPKSLFQATLNPENNSPSLPAGIPWDNLLYFDHLSPEWQTLYLLENHPVLIHRKLGQGEVILSASSYFLSNEAMLKDRRSGLLAWLVGNSKRVIFDEEHFSIGHHPGLVSLARKYHLEGFAVALALLTALFIWSGKNLIPPSPPLARGQTLQTSLGRDEVAGFVNLLRRNIAPGNLMAVCHQEWKKTFSRNRAIPDSKRKAVEEVMTPEKSPAPHPKNPVATYNNICQILTKRK